MKRLLTGCILLLALMLALPCAPAVGAESVDIDTMEGLKKYFSGKKIGVVTASTFDEIAREMFPDAERVYFNSIPDMMTGVATGKVDGVVNDAPAAIVFAQEMPETCYISKAILREDSYAYMINKQNTALCDQLNEFLRELKASGELQKIDDIWFGDDESLKKLPDVTLTGENGVIRVATDPTSPPFVYVSGGQTVGYDMDIFMRFAAKYGYAVEMTTMDIAAMLPAIVTGKADIGFCCISITPERAEQVLFSDANYAGGVVAVLPYDMKPAESEMDAYNKPGAKIGVPTGAMAMAAAEKRFPNAEIVHYANDTDAFLALKQGYIDAYAHDHITLRYAAETLEGVRVLAENYGGTDIAVGISKKRQDLVAPINAVIEKLNQSGVMEDMLRRWRTDAEHAMPVIAAPESPSATLQVGTAGFVAPMTYYGEDGELTGCDIELIKRIALDLNVKVEVETGNFDTLVAGLQSGKFDIVVSNLNMTPERAEMIYFSEPYMQLYLTLMVRGDAEKYATLGELQSYFKAGSKIGVNTGSIYDKIADEYFPGTVKVYYTTYPDAISGLKSGKIDGYLTDKPQAIAQCQSDSALWSPAAVIKDDRYAFAINKDNETLLAQVNQTLNRLRASGELDKMADKWFLPDEADKPMTEVTLTGENGELTLYTSATSYPFDYVREGESVGYEIEIFYLFCEEFGYKPVIETTEFSGVIAAISSGRADLAVACISITEERKEKMLFSEPTYYGGMVAVLPAAAQGGAQKAKEAVGFFEGLGASFERTFIREGRWKMIVSGLITTLIISVCAGIAGTLLGFIVCMMRRSRYKALSALAVTFIRIVQGTPIVVMLMILYYLVFDNVNAVLVAIVGFSINFAAYVSEMMRTGIDAVDKGQIEAASALGFTRARTFTGITMPQAARHFLPVFRGEFISLVKMTSVVGYITIQDLTKVSDIIRSRTYEAFFPLIATALIYFVLSWLLTLALSAIEIRLDPRHRKRAVKGIVAASADARAIRN